MDESTILITGSNGQLGKALVEYYPAALATDVEKLDITDNKSVESYDWANINTIINAAAYTDVDGAETPKGRVAAWKVNSQGAANLSKVAIEHNLLLVHISTEYVFDGAKDLYTEDEPPCPLSVYGASKAAGDFAVEFVPKHYVIRTSWLIGEGKNFVRTMIELGNKGINPEVVSDQIGRLTFAGELVKAIDHLLIKRAPFGVYNVSNSGKPVSWAEIARMIFKETKQNVKVSNTTTTEYLAKKTVVASRPMNSTLDLSKIESTGFKPTAWEKSLRDYIKAEQVK